MDDYVVDQRRYNNIETPSWRLGNGKKIYHKQAIETNYQTTKEHHI